MTMLEEATAGSAVRGPADAGWIVGVAFPDIAASFFLPKFFSLSNHLAHSFDLLLFLNESSRRHTRSIGVG
jgi:hypothetical protein